MPPAAPEPAVGAGGACGPAAPTPRKPHPRLPSTPLLAPALRPPPDGAAAAPAPAAGFVWYDDDGPVETPPAQAWAAWAHSGPPTGPLRPGAATPQLPPAAVARRSDLLSLPATLADHYAVPPSGDTWGRSLPRGGRRPPAADPLTVSPAAAESPPLQELACGQFGGTPTTAPTWGFLISSAEASSPLTLSLPAHAARRARVLADLSSRERTGIAAA